MNKGQIIQGLATVPLKEAWFFSKREGKSR